MTNILRVTTWMVAFATLLGSETASAAEAWATERHVTYLYPSGDGFRFGLDGDVVGTSTCGNRFFLPLSQAGSAYDAIVSTIITAFTADYLIEVAYDGDTANSCDIIINRVSVTQP